VIVRNVEPLVSHGATQFGQFYTCIVAAAIYTSEERSSSFNSHRQQVDTPACVVVSHEAPLHGGFLFAREPFIFPVSFLIHVSTANTIMLLFTFLFKPKYIGDPVCLSTAEPPRRVAVIMQGKSSGLRI